MPVSALVDVAFLKKLKQNLNNMEKIKYVRMWAEENHNNYDLLPIIRNYGPKMAYGISAQNAVAYAKDFHAEFYLKEDELKELGDKGFDFYVHSDGLNQIMGRVEEEFALQRAP